MRLIAAILCILVSPTASVAGERYALILSGAAGGEKYALQQEMWRDHLAAALKTGFGFPDANLVVLDEESTGTSRATADNARRLLADFRRRMMRDDTLFLMFIGHGTFDGVDAKFNLVGPDLSAAEWKGLLDGLPGRLVVVNTTESSFPFLEQLSQRGRVVITATDSAAQRFATVFPRYFVESLANPASDFDKNGRVSIWEAFAAASASVKQYYDQRGQLSTERPLLDDDGDKVGREAEAPGQDGRLARTVYLDPEPGSVSADAAVAALERQRTALQSRLEELKARKDSIAPSDYEAQLEKLLVELARVARSIKEQFHE